MTQDAIAERYGRTPAARRRSLVLGLGTLGAVLVVAIAWVLWAGFAGAAGALETRDLGYVTHEDTVDVSFEVSVDPGTPVSCALQALNQQFAIVGWKIVDLPGTASRTARYTENVRVSEPAVTGLIYRCWLA